MENDDLEAVKADIKKVEAKIDAVEEEIKAAAKNWKEAEGDEKKYWQKEKEDLRKEKEDLRDKEKDLRKEKEGLRRKEELLLQHRLNVTQGTAHTMNWQPYLTHSVSPSTISLMPCSLPLPIACKAFSVMQPARPLSHANAPCDAACSSFEIIANAL